MTVPQRMGRLRAIPNEWIVIILLKLLPCPPPKRGDGWEHHHDRTTNGLTDRNTNMTVPQSMGRLRAIPNKWIVIILLKLLP